ncbi:MAG: Trk system potassium transporter TrkA [Clostridia bacterium]|nr:Trk system potassium transporter TrkA [Clostridia bacterium]
MKIVIVGDGKVGSSLAEQLSKENHDITVIDSNPQRLQNELEKLDIMTLSGNGASLDVQRAANVDQSDLLIAATSSDEINMLCCIVARKLGAKKTIARVRNTDYTSQLQFLKDELGLSLTVSPERAAAREIFRILQFPSFLKRDTLARGRAEIVELKISDDSKLAGVKLKELQNIVRLKVLVCVIDRDGKVIVPGGNDEILPGDKITVTAPHSDLAKFVKNLKLSATKIKDVMIIGGSHIAFYLAEDLIKSGVGVKIIEKNAERCLVLAEKLPKAIIINADGSKHDILLEEGIKDMDAVITLTDIDEENLIMSIFANSIGVPKTITKINRTEYCDLFENKGLDSIIIPKQLTTTSIIRYVRAMSNTTGGSVRALHRLVDDKVEALEFVAMPDASYLDIPLSKLEIKKDVIIAAIGRQGKIQIAKGDDVILPGDIVVVITPAEQMITDLSAIFKKLPEQTEN